MVVGCAGVGEAVQPMRHNIATNSNQLTFLVLTSIPPQIKFSANHSSRRSSHPFYSLLHKLFCQLIGAKGVILFRSRGAAPTDGASAAAGFRSDTTHDSERYKNQNKQQSGPRLCFTRRLFSPCLRDFQSSLQYLQSLFTGHCTRKWSQRICTYPMPRIPHLTNTPY